MSNDELVDYAILPHSRIQHYEKTIEEQLSKISQQEAEIKSLQEPASKDNADEDNRADNHDKKEETPIPQTETVVPTEAEKPDNEVDPKQEIDNLKEGTKKNEGPLLVEKIPKGKNINKECLARQLKHKLKEASYSLPQNVDFLLKSATGGSKKVIPNEKHFYDAIISNNLVSLVSNPHKFNQYIRPTFFKI